MTGDTINVLFHCRDYPGNEAGQLRRELLKAHLDFVAEHMEHIRVAGPLYDEPGGNIVGSCLIYRAASVADAEMLFRKDPYAQCGSIWEHVETSVFRDVGGTWIGGRRW